MPERAVSNNDLSKLVDTSDEWITERTGIKYRRIIGDEAALSLAAKAARQAVESSKIDMQDIGLIIFSTITSDTLVPAASCCLRAELGIEHAVAFDLNAACTGFVYSLTVADAMMKSCGIKNALVVGCEALSRITDWNDRGTCILFGDGAGAAVLQNNDSDSGILSAFLDGENDVNGALTCRIGYDANPFNGGKSENKKIEMNGKAVFRYAVGAMTQAVTRVAENAGKGLDEIDWIVPHQANLRIIDSAAKKLKIPRERFFTNLECCGNTSSASIPMALDGLFKSGKVKKGDFIVLTGFGGGFTSGAVMFKA